MRDGSPVATTITCWEPSPVSPFPRWCAEFHRVISGRRGSSASTAELPDAVVACISGRSSAIRHLLRRFLDDAEGELRGFKPQRQDRHRTACGDAVHGLDGRVFPAAPGRICSQGRTARRRPNLHLRRASTTRGSVGTRVAAGLGRLVYEGVTDTEERWRRFGCAAVPGHHPAIECACRGARRLRAMGPGATVSSICPGKGRRHGIERQYFGLGAVWRAPGGRSPRRAGTGTVDRLHACGFSPTWVDAVAVYRRDGRSSVDVVDPVPATAIR